MTASITDFGQFTSLRASAERDDPAVLREVASQFEALFVQSLMKNMRGAELAEPMFNSEQMEMYQGMFDQQLSMEMANGRGIGLADMLVRQMGGEPVAVPRSSASYGLSPVNRPGDAAAAAPAWDNPDAFVADLWPHAERIGRKLGVAPQSIVAQAALETGWGEHVMHTDGGKSSYNLFGIKAGKDWHGDSVARPTLEFTDGVAERRVETFRAYPDIAAAMDDYARLIDDHPRYASVRGRGDDVAGFASALQSAGYATDPHYAEKVARVAGGDTLRDALRDLKYAAARPIATMSSSVVDD